MTAIILIEIAPNAIEKIDPIDVLEKAFKNTLII